MSMHLLGGAYIKQIVKTNDRVILTATACKLVLRFTGLCITSFRMSIEEPPEALSCDKSSLW